MRTLILARHGQAESNLAGIVESTPPGGGLTGEGIREAELLAGELASQPIELALCSRFLRAAQTLELAIAGRKIPQLVEPGLDEIDFGSFDGGPLAAYRGWAWEHAPATPCPGGGESRAEAAARFARTLEGLVARSEKTLLVVTHALPLRYVLDASDGVFPAARVVSVPHATPFVLEREAVLRAAAALHAWSRAPRFGDTPIGG